MGYSNKLTAALSGIVALFFGAYASADKVAQWDLRDYDGNGSVSQFAFSVPPGEIYPDGVPNTTDPFETQRLFGDQSVQRDINTGLPFNPPLPKETRCFTTDQEVTNNIIIFNPTPRINVPGYQNDFGQPCAPIQFDKGAVTDVREFTFGFLFAGTPFYPSIAATKANPSDIVGDTGDVSAEITIDKNGNYSLVFSRLDFAGLFGTGLFILPPTTNPPGASDPNDPSTIRQVDPSTAHIQELVHLGGADFGASVQWISKIYEVGSNFNDNVARWRVEGVMTVQDDAPIIFINDPNPAGVLPGGSYVDAGAVCQDVVDGEITSASLTPASYTTTPANPNISPVGAAGTSFTITYDCVDSAGQSTQAIRAVDVEADNTAPTINLLAGAPESGRDDAADGSIVDITVGKTYIDAGATCVDKHDGVIPLGTTGSPSFTFAPTFVDTTTASTGNQVVFTCTDSVGNTTQATRLVNVIADNVDPVLTLGPPAIVTISVGSQFVPNVPASTCIDTNPIDIGTGTPATDISGNVTTSPQVIDTRFPHTELVTYNCVDAAGNAATPIVQQVDIVQGTTFNILSMTISDVDNDGLAGCFKFASLDPATCNLANAFSSDNSVTGTLTGGNATIAGSGTDLDSNGNPIGIRFGVFQQNIGEISPGFLFAGFPFQPFTFDPPSESASPPSGVVLQSSSGNSLIVNSLPFSGLYSSSQPNAFFLDPDDGTFSGQITADNMDDDGTTRSFNYLMNWSHFITSLEDPTGQFPTFTAFWRLEGKVTVDSNPVVFNNPPIIDYISASQGALASTRTVVSTAGNVTATAAIVEPDGDNLTYDWSGTDAALMPVGTTSGATFVFDPSAAPPGTYNIELTVTDDGTSPESATTLLAIKVLAVAPALGAGDSDFDGTPDNTEGFGDSDMDGLPDYQDAIDGTADSRRNRLDYSVPAMGDITIDKGILVLGSTAFGAGNSSFLVTEDEITANGGPGGSSVTNGEDPLNAIPGLGHSGGGINDWTANGVFLGDTVCAIVPQDVPLPAVPIYRRYSPAGWVDFVVSGADTLASAPKVGGVCSEIPADYDASAGFVPGDECIRVCVTDGGANDLDLLRNGSVSDPAAVANNGAVPVADGGGGGCSVLPSASASIARRMDWVVLFIFLAGLYLVRYRRV